MRRDAGVETIRWFTTDPCYVFHPMNMWEEGDKIYADVMEYPVRRCSPTPTAPAEARPPGWCAGPSISPDNSNTIKREPLDDMAGDSRASMSAARGFPIATAVSRHHRAGGGLGGSTPSRTSTSQRGKRSDHVSPAGDSPGEPVFVPRSADAPEGDGWLLAWSIAAPRTAATSPSSRRRLARPVASPSCRAACPSASTATGARPRPYWPPRRPAAPGPRPRQGRGRRARGSPWPRSRPWWSRNG